MKRKKRKRDEIIGWEPSPRVRFVGAKSLGIIIPLISITGVLAFFDVILPGALEMSLKVIFFTGAVVIMFALAMVVFEVADVLSRYSSRIYDEEDR